MGFLSLFSSSTKPEDKLNSSSNHSGKLKSASNHSGRSSSSSSSSKKKSHRNRSSGSRSRKAKSVASDDSTTGRVSASAAYDFDDSLSPNEQIIARFVDTVNQHGTVEEMLAFFSSKDAPTEFEDELTMTALQILEEVRKLYMSFENFHFHYTSIKEVRPGKVLVEDLCATGTHTGVPFAFANYPAIPANNKHVVLDEERLWFTVNEDAKICRWEITALGNLTGPPGMYVSVGGKLEMPPADKKEG